MALYETFNETDHQHVLDLNLTVGNNKISIWEHEKARNYYLIVGCFNVASRRKKILNSDITEKQAEEWAKRWVQDTAEKIVDKEDQIDSLQKELDQLRWITA